MRNKRRLYLAVAVGSAFGAVSRYLCSMAFLHLFGSAFPWGTLVVNAVGSLLIGLYATLTGPDGRLIMSPFTRHLVTVGFCGGFTTFSVFSLETVLLLEQQRFYSASLNAGLSVLLCPGLAWLGYRLGAKLNRLKRS